MNEELKTYAAFICLILIIFGFIIMLLSPLYSIILNTIIPAKPIYKTNSSIIHRDISYVKCMRKRHNSKVFIFGLSMCLSGLIMINSTK